MNKIYGATWFTQMGNLKIIGIVTYNDGYEDKANIGTTAGINEDDDTKHIMRTGARFPFELAIKMTGGKDE